MQLTTKSVDTHKPYVFNFVKTTGEVQPRFVGVSEYPVRRKQCFEGFLKPGNKVVVFREGEEVEVLRHKDAPPMDEAERMEAEGLKWLDAQIARMDTRRAERARALQRNVKITRHDGDKVYAEVPSSNGGKYNVVVGIGAGTYCHCEDMQGEIVKDPHHLCKHVGAVIMAIRATWPVVVTEDYRRALKFEFEQAKQRMAHPEFR